LISGGFFQELDLDHLEPDVADRHLARIGLDVGEERGPVGEPLLVGPDVELAEGDVGDAEGLDLLEDLNLGLGQITQYLNIILFDVNVPVLSLKI
jgi:hypothetical protein